MQFTASRVASAIWWIKIEAETMHITDKHTYTWYAQYSLFQQRHCVSDIFIIEIYSFSIMYVLLKLKFIFLR